MPIKLGTIGKKLPFIKVCLGSLVKFQELLTEITFSTCPFPTSWTAVKTGTSYTADNKYGTWKISATSYSSYDISKAFDNNSSTYWKTASQTSRL